MKLAKPDDESRQPYYSINDVLKAWKLHYEGKSRVLFILHMAILIPLLLIRYAIIAPVIKYIKDLWAEQNGSPFRNK